MDPLVIHIISWSFPSISFMFFNYYEDKSHLFLWLHDSNNATSIEVNVFEVHESNMKENSDKPSEIAIQK